jgi:hypothetical protein
MNSLKSFMSSLLDSESIAGFLAWIVIYLITLIGLFITLPLWIIPYVVYKVVQFNADKT